MTQEVVATSSNLIMDIMCVETTITLMAQGIHIVDGPTPERRYQRSYPSTHRCGIWKTNGFPKKTWSTAKLAGFLYYIYIYIYSFIYLCIYLFIFICLFIYLLGGRMQRMIVVENLMLITFHQQYFDEHLLLDGSLPLLLIVTSLMTTFFNLKS